MTSFLLYIIIISAINKCNTQTIKCPNSSGDCVCPTISSETACILECIGKFQCRETSLKCRHNDPCVVKCIGESACDQGFKLNFNQEIPTDVTLICDGSYACRQAQMRCGTGDCNVTCSTSDSCTNQMSINSNNAHSFSCTPSNYCPPAPAPFTSDPSPFPTISPTFPTTATPSTAMPTTLSPTTHGTTVYCSNFIDDCECGVGTGPCILNCIGTDSCYWKTIDCRDYESCEINCESAESCQGAELNYNGLATDVSINCMDEEACSDATVECGTGKCTLHCSSSQACDGIDVKTFNAESFECTGSCPSSINALEYSANPTEYPSNSPTTNEPTAAPTLKDEESTTLQPSNRPTFIPSISPSKTVTMDPTISPSNIPALYPTSIPSIAPSKMITNDPTIDPTISPSNIHTLYPTSIPSIAPSKMVTMDPTLNPVASTNEPTKVPSLSPQDSTKSPSNDPTYISLRVTMEQTSHPSISPTIKALFGVDIKIKFKYGLKNNSNITKTEIQKLVTNVAINLMKDVIDQNDKCFGYLDWNITVNNNDNEASIGATAWVCDQQKSQQLTEKLQTDDLDTKLSQKVDEDGIGIQIIDDSTDIEIETVNDTRSDTSDTWMNGLLFYIIIIIGCLFCCALILCLVMIMQYKKLKKRNKKKATDTINNSKAVKPMNINTNGSEIINLKTKQHHMILKVDSPKSESSNYVTPKPPPRREQKQNDEIEMETYNDNDNDHLNGTPQYLRNPTEDVESLFDKQGNLRKETEDIDGIFAPVPMGSDHVTPNGDMLPLPYPKSDDDPELDQKEDNDNDNDNDDDDDTDSDIPPPPPIVAAKSNEQSEDSLDRMQHQYLQEEINREEDEAEIEAMMNNDIIPQPPNANSLNYAQISTPGNTAGGTPQYVD